MHNVIIIPGLGDRAVMARLATKHWKNYGLIPIIYSMNWHDGEEFRSKLNRLLKIVDGYLEIGANVSLVGCSAGASAALNVFWERKIQINKVVSVCGRLRVGDQKGFRSLRVRAKNSSAFIQSVKLLESRIDTFTPLDKERIMTVSAEFGDELVPANTSMLSGAYNLTIPTIQHSISIYSALTVFSNKLISFMLL